MLAITSKTRRVNKPSWPFVLNSASDLSNGLIGWWSPCAQHGRKILDLSRVLFNHGTLAGFGFTNSSGYTIGKDGGNALRYDATDDYVDFTTAKYPNGIANVSMLGWFNATAISSLLTLLFSRSVTAGVHLSQNTGSPLTYTWQGTSDEYSAATGLTVPTSKWCFGGVVVTPTAATVYLYADTLQSWTNTKTHATKNFNNGTWCFGRDSSFGRYWNGMIGDFYFYNRSLNVSEVWKLCAPSSRWELRYQPGLKVYSFAAGGTTHNLTISVDVTASSTIARQVGKILSVSESVTSTIIRSIGKGVALSAACTQSIVKSCEKSLSLNASQSSTLAAATTFARTLAVSVSAAISLAKSVGKALSLSVAAVVTIVLSVLKSLSLAASAAVSMTATRAVLKDLTVNVSATITRVLSVNKSLAVSSSAVATMLRSISKTLSVSVSEQSTLSAIRAFLVTLSVSVSATLSIVRSVGKGVSLSVSATPSVAKSCAHSISLSASAAVSMLKSVGKSVSASASSVSSLAGAKVVAVTLAVNVAQSLSLTKSVNKLVSALCSSQSSGVRSIGKSLSKSVSSVSSLVAQLLGQFQIVFRTTMSKFGTRGGSRQDV